MVVVTGAHKNRTFLTKGKFLHNTKVTTSKINEDKIKEYKRGIISIKEEQLV